MSAVQIRRPGRPAEASNTAAKWVLLQEQSPLSTADQDRLANWLGEDEAHIVAYDNALHALDAMARHAGEPELLEMRQSALAASGGGQQTVRRWVSAITAIAASVALWAIWAGHQQPLVSTPKPEIGQVVHAPVDVYRTALGERKSIVLPDRSVATLDTGSELRVDFGGTARAIHLVKGQALFEVAHGDPRPFEVYAKGQLITATGTTFNVRIEGEDVEVAMIEGSVRVRAAPGPDAAKVGQPIRELSLSAGESLVIEPIGPLAVTPIDTRQVATWKGGLLVFNDTPLHEAVAEVNRYTAKPITIADRKIGDYRVTGVFQSNDPEHFSQALREMFPIEVMHAENGAPRLTLRN
ncbi:FecR family protein [Croceicoccus sediminis]|uniref:FecR family protein n=1 Tax=Croceicoccus sediminis TaxID=2571150 RepID=UPI001182F6F5|nr:FecR domain-containing protein [Croceicoccus sediminis]